MCRNKGEVHDFFGLPQHNADRPALKWLQLAVIVPPVRSDY